MHHLTHLFFSAFILTVTSPLMNAQDLTSNLIAHFPMNGSPIDVIGGLAPIVTSGQPNFCPDSSGNATGAACFDGASFWSYGDVLGMDTSDFTVAAWVKVDTVYLPFEIAPNFISEGSSVLNKGTTIHGTPSRAGYSIILTQANGDSIDLYGATGDATSDLRLNMTRTRLHAWTHIALSRCGDHQLLHVNGVLVADSIVPVERDLDVDIVFSMGAMNRDPTSFLDSEWFIGALDDVRIYRDRCLSQQDIDCLVNPLPCTVGFGDFPDSKNTLELYPNPAHDALTAFVPDNMTGPCLLTVSDPTSRRVFEQSAQAKSIILDVAEWKAGTYFVVLQSEQGQAHGRFIKE